MTTFFGTPPPLSIGHMLRTCLRIVVMSAANSNTLFLAASRPTQPGGVDFVVAWLGSGRLFSSQAAHPKHPSITACPSYALPAPPYILCGEPR
ncbi:hypothetical protein LZ31DRAFT_557190 [Colletotrichum somersetense]|nr:hypothetical protein LZ31DRAFT_557190 [Colletotrichum somersetense]